METTSPGTDHGPDYCSVFVDFDGVIIHQEQHLQWELKEDAVPCPGSIERINTWFGLGHRIFITTARTKEDLPKLKAWAKKHKLKYTDIILNCGRGPRYLINDIDPTLKLDKAVAYCITRNSGLEKIEALSGSSIKPENGKESKV